MNIVLGVSGGIAAYKAVQVARLFVEAGHELTVVPTADALRFVGAPTWEAISRNPVTTSVHDDVPEVRHVALGQRAELVVVAPATANTIARMAAGIADDLLGTTLLATRAPVLIAPAMHTEMWQHPSTQHNIGVLAARGVHVIGPETGRLTGDDTGPGRMSEPDVIVAAALKLLAGAAGASVASHTPAVLGADQPAAARSEVDSANTHPTTPTPVTDLSGTRVLVTAGGTREPVDPVRYLGNRSSGRQGVAVAAAAAERGAETVLISANIDTSVLQALPGSVRVVHVGSAADLETALEVERETAGLIVMAAAVADYRLAEVSSAKLRKEDTPGEPPVLRLVENPDLLRGLTTRRLPGQVIVGFAAETVENDDDLLARGRRKLARKGADLLAVNAVGWNTGFESDTNSLTVLAAGGEVVAQATGTKREAADALLDAAVHALREARA